ncbi:MAG: hypothetical protein ACI8XB_001567 [Patiriisocius sp.]|jgi:hypothetical protein
MNKGLGTYELIQNFLDGKLSGDALMEFERRRLVENGFEQYLQNHKAANQLIRNKELASIKRELKSIHLKSSGFKGFWSGLTVLVILVSAGSWIYLSESKDNVFDSKSNSEITSKDEVFEDQRTDIESTAKLIVKSDKVDSFQSVVNKTDGRMNENVFEPAAKANIDASNISEMIKKEALSELVRLTVKPDVLAPLEGVLGTSEETAHKEKVICDSYSVTLDIDVIPSCSDKNNGRIKIRNEEFPQNYSFMIDDNYPQLEREFNTLAKGNYNVMVLDGNRCKSNPTIVEVGERNCDIIISQSQSVFWEIPIELTFDKNANLEVYNAKSGQLVYAKQLDSNGANVWKGHDSNDQILPMGLYIYNIKYRNNQDSGEIRILN